MTAAKRCATADTECRGQNRPTPKPVTNWRVTESVTGLFDAPSGIRASKASFFDETADWHTRCHRTDAGLEARSSEKSLKNRGFVKEVVARGGIEPPTHYEGEKDEIPGWPLIYVDPVNHFIR